MPTERPTASLPPQQQQLPGDTAPMRPQPADEMRDYVGRGLLTDKKAIVTGGDSGIGRATAVAFAKEGADVVIAYLNETDDAAHTKKLIEATGRNCTLVAGDLAEEKHCKQLIQQATTESGIDILVNNIATQQPYEALEDITSEQWLRTFDVNIHSFFWTTKAALPHLGEGSAIINTASVNGLRGNKNLVDYSATKGAVLSFTYALAQQLAPRKIRVNAVAPGPVWTPLIPASFDEEHVKNFGANTPLARPAQPDEIAPSYVFFAASTMSSFYSGEVLAPLGGETMPG